MGIFHVFKNVQMVPNCPLHHVYSHRTKISHGKVRVYIRVTIIYFWLDNFKCRCQALLIISQRLLVQSHQWD